MDKAKLEAVLESHGKWLNDDGGERADLCDADLRGADLRGADLRGANLCGADLCDANLYGADLPEKIVQIGPIGSRKSYTVYNATRDVVQCGCWNNYKGGTLEDFRKRVEEVYQDGQYLERNTWPR